MPDIIDAYRKLIATAAERKTNRFYFSEPLENGKEADEYRFTLEYVRRAPIEPPEEAIGACDNLKCFIEMPLEYATTPECIAPALEEFQQILDLLNDLSARVAAIEAPANAPA